MDLGKDRSSLLSMAMLLAASSCVLAKGVRAETCYFNGRSPLQCTPTWSYAANQAMVRIAWVDGVRETYVFPGYDGTNASLGVAVDPRGGRWQFIDRRDGCRWQLKHVSNANVITVSRCR